MADDPNEFDGWFDGTPGNQAPDRALTGETLDEWIEHAFRENGGPGYGSALINMLKGVRILGPGNQMAPIPDDNIGLVFVNRPLLNLSDENVVLHQQLLPLYEPPRNSLQAYVKGLLDPVWGRANSGDDDLLDPLYAWIAPITNLCKVSSGFPDVSLNVAKSTPGLRKEVYQYVDGILKVNYDFDMRLSMHNPKPNIIPFIFDVWNHYIEGVTLGDEGMEPYDEALTQNYRDYDCRVYHIILGKDMRSIEGIYCNGYSWPNTYPSGAFSTIDRTTNTLRGQGQDEVEITFPSVIFRYNNIRIADQFNRTTVFFNPNLHPQVRDMHYRKLKFSEYFSGAYKAYPWININTMQMEYWSRI
jgi:hypothetical protein